MCEGVRGNDGCSLGCLVPAHLPDHIEEVGGSWTENNLLDICSCKDTLIVCKSVEKYMFSFLQKNICCCQENIMDIIYII